MEGTNWRAMPPPEADFRGCAPNEKPRPNTHDRQLMSNLLVLMGIASATMGHIPRSAEYRVLRFLLKLWTQGTPDVPSYG